MTKKETTRKRTLTSGILISCRNIGTTVDPRMVRRRAQRLLASLGLESSELSIVLCDDPFIRDLNSRFRRKDKPTDVLSFPMEADESGGAPGLLGDVIISVETAARQAKERGRRPIDEVTSLLIHGILHLVGCDHNTQKERRRMFAEAKRLENVINTSR